MLSSVVVIGIALSLYYLQGSQESTNSEEVPQKKVLFYSKNNLEEPFQTFIEGNEKTYAKTIRKAMDQGLDATLISDPDFEVEAYDSFIFEYEKVKENKEIKSDLSKAFANGKKVYLYDDEMSERKFVEVLGLEDSSPEFLSEVAHSVIGYEKSAEHFSINGISNTDEEGNETELKPELVLMDILWREAEDFLSEEPDKENTIGEETVPLTIGKVKTSLTAQGLS